MVLVQPELLIISLNIGCQKCVQPIVAILSSEVLPVPHYSYDMPTEEEERFEQLFRQLDVNGDGRIDIVELSQSLHKHGVPDNLKESYATVCFHFL